MIFVQDTELGSSLCGSENSTSTPAIATRDPNTVDSVGAHKKIRKPKSSLQKPLRSKRDDNGDIRNKSSESKSKSFSPSPIRGNTQALFKLSRAAKRDIEGWIHGQYAAVEKVGHELTNPTGTKFVFYLSFDEEEEEDEEDMSDVQLSPYAEAELYEPIGETDIEMDEAISMRSIHDFHHVSALHHDRNSEDEHNILSVARGAIKNNAQDISTSLQLDTVADAILNHDMSKGDRLPRSDRKPSLARLIASADPDGFPLSDSDSETSSRYDADLEDFHCRINFNHASSVSPNSSTYIRKDLDDFPSEIGYNYTSSYSSSNDSESDHPYNLCEFAPRLCLDPHFPGHSPCHGHKQRAFGRSSKNAMKVIRERFEAKYWMTGNMVSSPARKRENWGSGAQMLLHGPSSLRNEAMIDEEENIDVDSNGLKIDARLLGVYNAADASAQVSSSALPVVVEDGLYDAFGFLTSGCFEEGIDGAIDPDTKSEFIEGDAVLDEDVHSGGDWQGSFSCPHFPISAFDEDADRLCNHFAPLEANNHGHADFAPKTLQNSIFAQNEELGMGLKSIVDNGLAHQDITGAHDETITSYLEHSQRGLAAQEGRMRYGAFNNVLSKQDEEPPYPILRFPPVHHILRTGNASSNESLNHSLQSSIFSKRTSLASKSSYDSVKSNYSRLFDALDLEIEAQKCSGSCSVCTTTLQEVSVADIGRLNTSSNDTTYVVQGGKRVMGLPAVPETPRESNTYEATEKTPTRVPIQGVLPLNDTLLQCRHTTASLDTSDRIDPSINSCLASISTPQHSTRTDEEEHNPTAVSNSTDPPSTLVPYSHPLRAFDESIQPEQNYSILFDQFPQPHRRHWAGRVKNVHQKTRKTAQKVVNSTKKLGKTMRFFMPVTFAACCPFKAI